LPQSEGGEQLMDALPMADVTGDHSGTPAGVVPSRQYQSLTAAPTSLVPPLLFGLRLWASVCLALYVAFWLELDNAYWAGTSAAIVCQPQLGASLRKGWFRLIGTAIGATMIVVLTACFPQDRIAFLGGLALWCALAAFLATVLRNFASYAAALAGYTAAIISIGTLGATGGPNPEVFMLAVRRASEISIGIVCAGIVLAGTDLGGARRRLAGTFATVAAEITRRFTSMLAQAGPDLPDFQDARRELTRRVIALDPTIDQAMGESSELRYHSPILQTAVHGLFSALAGWRAVATHLALRPDEQTWQQAETVLRSLPPELRSAPGRDAPTRWMTDSLGFRRSCDAAVQTLLALPTDQPSLRLITDQTTKLLAGVSSALDGLALLVDAPGRPPLERYSFRLSVPDWLPALANAGRAFVAVGALELFWVATAWSSGILAVTFVAVAVLLLSPRGDLAPSGAIAFAIGTALAVPFAATIKFAVLPGLESFAAFSIALGLYLIPVGFGVAQSRKPAVVAVLSVMAFIFVPVLQPSNEMIYDTAQFYNTALSIFAGCAAAALSFRLLPPLSPSLRTRRLLAFALRDLRRSAIAVVPPPLNEWEERMYGRLAAMPDQAEPLQRAQLLAALAVGSELIRLRRMSSMLALDPELDTALAALARGESLTATTVLARLDHRLSSNPGAEPRAHLAVRARAIILVVSETLTDLATYFDTRVSA
jgi:uncharacterized membrane protein YccC